MYLGYLKDSATCKRAFQITGKQVNEVIEKPRDSVYMVFETTACNRPGKKRR